MKMDVLFMVFVFRTFFRTNGVLRSATIVKYLVDNTLFLEGPQGAVQRGSIQPFEVPFDISVGERRFSTR